MHHAPESRAHSDAKAMLVAWAREQAPAATVRAESSIKDPIAQIHRRPDVTVRWPRSTEDTTVPDPEQQPIAFAETGAPLRGGEPVVALEVEYKAWTVAGWKAKQADLTATGTAVTWLFGHLPRYLAQPPVPADWPPEEVWDRVLIRAIPATVAAYGMPVLHVHPGRRLVGTVVVDGLSEDTPGWWRHPEDVGQRLPRGEDTEGRLVVCGIDECRLDPVRGLITPVMDDIDAERIDRAVRAEILAASHPEPTRVPPPRRIPQPAPVIAPKPKAVRNVEPRPRAGAEPTRSRTDHHCGQCAYRVAMGLPVTTGW